MSNFIKSTVLGVTMICFGSCIGNYEDFNTNPYQPAKVPANELLSDMFKVYASPQQNDCQTINGMWAAFSGQITAPANWSKGTNLFAYYNAMDDHNDRSWGYLYPQIYTNLFRIEELTGKKGVIYAVAQLTRVFAMHMMASLQGPIPYTQIEAGKTQAAYDDEKTAWHAMFDDLDKAIMILQSAAELGVNQDLADVDQFYAGDCTKWLKFANTLKLRMAIRISGIEPEFAQMKGEEAVRAGVMENKSDSSYDIGSSNIGVNGYSIVKGWGEIKANACLVAYMNGYNDPRRTAYFTEQTQTAEGGYVGVRSGSVDIPEPTTYSNYSDLMITTNREKPQPVMYAAEAAFLCAEGALRGWNMGGSAQSFYEKGVRIAFDEFGISGVDSYLADAVSTPGDYQDVLISGHNGNNYANQSEVTIKWDEGVDFDTKLERILTQKWIACFLDPLNGWSDFRRTGFPKIFPATKSMNSDCTVERGQRRIRFAQNEYNTNNKNVTAAVALLSNGKDSNGTDLWWALKADGNY